MLGTYAVRIRFFSTSDVLIDRGLLRHEIIQLAKVTADSAGKVWMETRRCYDFGAADAAGQEQTFIWRNPTALAPEKVELLFHDGMFAFGPDPREIGYTAESPAECKPGARLPRPDEKWRADGTCECRSEPLPIVSSDCRITDADNDGFPGITVDEAGFAKSVNYVRVKDNCQIVNGKLAPDSKRHQANYIQNYDYYQVACNGAKCDRSPAPACPVEVNPVSFHPLSELSPAGGAWDCAEVMKQVEADKFFTAEMLNFPQSGC